MACFDLGVGSLVVHNGLPSSDMLLDSCLMQSYLGTFGGQSIFVPPESLAIQSDLPFSSMVPRETTELVVVYQNAVENSESEVGDAHLPWYWLDERLEEATRNVGWMYLPSFGSKEVRQGEVEGSKDAAFKDYDDNVNWENAFGSTQASEVVLAHDTKDVPPAITTIYRTPAITVLAFTNLTSASVKLDELLEPSYRLGVVSYPPTPVLPVPSDDVSRVRDILISLKYEQTVADLVNLLSITTMRQDITWLTGEAEDSPIESRHSFHPDSRKAAAWIKEQIEGTGAKCELRSFLVGFAPNVICRYNGTEDTTALVLFSAHYDSRGSFGQTRAPGGDDDGSGTVAILNIARSIALSGITFKSNVELCLFAGEEQGLLGSRAYARDLRAENANITLMVQADMLAYHAPDEPPQLGLPDIIGTPEVTQLIANVSTLYSPELKIGFTPACCSDHQSFHEQGFAASQVFERAGPIADPMYHNSGDLSRRPGYDLHQLRSIAKVQFATLLHAAGFNVPARVRVEKDE